MADVTLSPNMGLPVPNVGVDPGPDWANNNNSCLVIVDGHNHTAGSGVQIPPSGLNINSDLTFNSNNATQLRSTRYTPQGSPLAAAFPDLGCLYVSGVDLYYNDGNGNQIRITQSGSVTGAAGTITGLPSGTASAAFVAGTGTFQFQQATSTAANMDVGTLVLRYPGSYPTPTGTNYISLQVPSTISTGYSLTLPAAPPSADAYLTMSPTGVLSVGLLVPSALQISNSSGAFSTASPTYVDVPNLAITATFSGRPIEISFQPDGSGPAGAFVTNNQGIQVALVKDSVIIAEWLWGANSPQATFKSFLPPGFKDLPAAGSHTYKVQILAPNNTSGVSLTNTVLVIQEF